MRVLMVSKALVVGIYQRKLELIAQQGVELLAVVPPSWRDERGEMALERVYTEGYRLEVLPIRRNGDFHAHTYVGLDRLMHEFRPQIVHIDEEPYNVAAWQVHYFARRVGAKSLFFTWQNIERHYPPPFSWGERWMLRTVDYAIAGTQSAAEVWKAKGYTGAMRVIPQFGVDAALFTPTSVGMRHVSSVVPSADLTSNTKPFTIGYFGRLVEEKGLFTLLDAVAKLSGDWRLRLVGGGPLKDALYTHAESLGIVDNIEFCGQIASTDMPAQYQALDVLVLPSLTRPNWKEQFGRVLVEAMASGIPVIGSDSGAIPDVIGEAGLVFPEGDADALHERLTRICGDSALRQSLIEKGHARVRAHFTQEQVAYLTVEVYQRILQE